MESNSNYTVIKPQQQQNHQNSEKMLEEYMSKLNKREEKSNGIASKKIPVTVQQAPEVPDFKPKKSGGLEVTTKKDFFFYLAMNVPMYIALAVLTWPF